MKIHEHQAKEIFRRYDVPTPVGRACLSLQEADNAIADIDGGVWVVKAQIHAGGRGKGGGVKVTKSVADAKLAAQDIFGMTLITHQTGPEGQEVKRLLIEEGCDIAAEMYVGLVTDRKAQKTVLMASSEGGMDIEEVAARTPEKIHKVWLNPLTNTVDDDDARALAEKIGVPEKSRDEAVSIMKNLARVYTDTDASLIEINPFTLTGDGRLLALDGKMNFDDNGLFRRPDIAALRDWDEEDPAETEAAKYDLSYVSLDGDIGCMVNGAGLAMATMDIIKLCGGEANFLDVGGGAGREQVTAAFKLMLANPKIRAILINIFGGIMRCDVIAEGVVAAAKEVSLHVPLVVRLEGTNVEQGKNILKDSGLAIIAATTMADAAQKAVAATKSN
ncbi:MAG: ADP-forming succinate--CoA ligase subunit beta [Candidatus Zeuxoniibacter abyssi]|nr:MAG: ADP-forming succinate--CoA ligase subunit beta [Candidatus Persebacteraceae bacterium AB1(2)]